MGWIELGIGGIGHGREGEGVLYVNVGERRSALRQRKTAGPAGVPFGLGRAYAPCMVCASDGLADSVTDLWPWRPTPVSLELVNGPSELWA